MHLTKSQLLTLSEHGWEIGSHSHLHRSFKWMSNDEIKDEVVTSKRIIENITGKEVISFCLPFGDYTRKAIEIIEEAGIPGKVTISTNMAGRGTDIKLGGIKDFNNKLNKKLLMLVDY